MREADHFLRDHQSCNYVEVWRSGVLVGVHPPTCLD
jgi:hypothetical protein